MNKPQKSERWAMYRLIAPVVDFANSTLGFEAYFELNQTSSHGTSQSVDIALLHGLEPRVMIEAKRIDRRIAAEQISKYLQPNVRGLVTYGINWVLCLNGVSKTISLCGSEEITVSVDSLNEIIAFIRGEEIIKSGWTTEQKYVDPVVKPGKLHKEANARRVSNQISVAEDVNSLRRAVVDLSFTSALDKVFLQALSEQFEKQCGIPKHLRCEVRASRIVFFDDRANARRVARVELGKRQPDVLVLTELVTLAPHLALIASAAPHDKGPHMRRFRLSEELQTKDFGKCLAEVLSV